MNDGGHRFILDLSRLRPKIDLEPFLHSLARRFDLKNVAYGAFNVPGRPPYTPIGVYTYSEAWINRYIERNYIALDPTWALPLAPNRAVDWAEFDRKDPQLRRFFGEAAEYGVGRNGLSMPVSGSRGERGFLAVTSDVDEEEWLDFRRTHQAELQSIASHLHSTVMLCEGAYGERPEVRLTTRERECLQWAAAGKTGQDIGTILGISERVVRIHLDSARHKLDALNISHAVARGISYGLIAEGV